MAMKRIFDIIEDFSNEIPYSEVNSEELIKPNNSRYNYYLVRDSKGIDKHIKCEKCYTTVSLLKSLMSEGTLSRLSSVGFNGKTSRTYSSIYDYRKDTSGVTGVNESLSQNIESLILEDMITYLSNQNNHTFKCEYHGYKNALIYFISRDDFSKLEAKALQVIEERKHPKEGK